MQPATPPLEVTPEELEALLETVREALGEAGYQKLKAAIRTLSYVTELLETREATLASLRRLLCHTRSEKTEAVLEQAGIPRSPTPREPSTEVGSKKPGHGRKGAKAYPGAQRIEVPHATLYRGDRCPGCQRGKVYPLSEPGLLVRLRGQAPIAATVYELEKLRCNLCGEVFTAEAPAGVGEKKYDPTTASMIALLRYGSGFPWNRLADLEESLGVPLPVATQCEIGAEAAATLQPAMEELIRQAAQGAVLHNDDTSMPVLALRRRLGMEKDENASDAAARTGVFTSGIVSTAQKQTIALFFTGRQHAGENLADVLRQRAAELAPPLQMCDALSRNLPKLPEKLEVIVGHCLAHARRRFVEVIENFPQPCQYVLEQLGTVYGHDATARQQAMTPEERLRYHQQHSAPVMEELRGWLNTQFAEKKVEPNSGLGMAMRYLLKHWERLTLFLRQPGAPLDNNIAERALKKAILHRKNSLFYKTANGARVGDLFMSLIHTCELSGANPFDYLTQLQRHAGDLVRNPRQWMPWNYQATLESCGARLDSG
ncbi:MAG TPA: IS66 family transposase [Candidatus Methylomirabilis sp.]|nr:IS66 family transposase [Candidatus Methylomirabilis sp.]